VKDDIAASIKRGRAEDAKAAKEAAAILHEDDPRTPAEQAALDAIARYRWVPVHAKDWNTAIVRLISIAGLLHDPGYEKRQAEADTYWSAYNERVRTANIVAYSRLNDLAEQAADRLDAGDDPAEVARWMRTTREAISNSREKAAV
jgi:hypothetical protein